MLVLATCAKPPAESPKPPDKPQPSEPPPGEPYPVVDFGGKGEPQLPSKEDPKLCGAKRFTHAHARDTRRRVRRACRSLGNAAHVCEVYDTIVVRESNGNAQAVCTKGPGEVGFGPMCLSARWQGPKWPGPPEEFCIPEVAAVVTHEIFWRAVTAYDAETLADLQAIFGFHVWEDGRGGLMPAQYWRHRPAFCRRLADRGLDCNAPVTRSDLGRRLRKDQRAAFVDRLLRSRPSV